MNLCLEINTKIDSLTPLRETVTNTEQSIQHLYAKYDDILENLAHQDVETKGLKKRVKRVESANAEAEIRNLKEQINQLEWRGRRLNLEILGVPEEANEVLLSKINDVATRLGHPELNVADVVAMHRFPAKADKIPVIVLRFSRQVRDKWLERKRMLKRS